MPSTSWARQARREGKESGKGQGQRQVIGKGNDEAAWESGKGKAKLSSACESGMDRGMAAWESGNRQGQGQVLGKGNVEATWESGKGSAKHSSACESGMDRGMAAWESGKGQGQGQVLGKDVAACESGKGAAKHSSACESGMDRGMAACESGRGGMVNHSLYKGSHPCGIPTKSLETQGQGQVQVLQRSACESGKGAAVQAFLGQAACEGGNGIVAAACECGKEAADRLTKVAEAFTGLAATLSIEVKQVHAMVDEVEERVNSVETRLSGYVPLEDFNRLMKVVEEQAKSIAKLEKSLVLANGCKMKNQETQKFTLPDACFSLEEHLFMNEFRCATAYMDPADEVQALSDLMDHPLASPELKLGIKEVLEYGRQESKKEKKQTKNKAKKKEATELGALRVAVFDASDDNS